MISQWKRILLLSALLGTTMVLAAGCAASATPTEEHTDEETDAGPEENEETIPNNGAVIRIVSPEDGTTITGDQVEVKIEVENFDLSEAHWHIAVDGEERGEIEGGDTSYVLRGLEAGTHEIEVTLGTAEEQVLEDGDSITLTINP